MKNAVYTIFAGFFLCAGALLLHAQQPSLYFNRISRENGLSNNKVNCIVQDQRGFIWIGTDDGLNRYDGHNFVVFKNIPGQASSLSGNTIKDLHVDKEGRLWIATSDGGISRYDHRLPPKEQFRQYKHHPCDSNSIPVNIVNKIKEDASGNLWLATSGASVLRFNKKKEVFEKVWPAGGLTIYDLCFLPDGTIWGGREGGSILTIDPQSLQAKGDPRYKDFYAALPHVVVASMFRDSRSQVWLGSWDKAVYRKDPATGKETSFRPQKTNPFAFREDEAIAFNEDKQGRIWMGGRYRGLHIYEPATGRFYNYQSDPAREGSLSHNMVNCIYTDRNGVIWLGTGKGISLYQPQQQQFRQRFLPGAENRSRPPMVYDFLRQGNGDLWIATSKGIYIHNREGKFIHKKISYKGVPVSVGLFFRDVDGSLYLGTDYTLLKYDERTGRVASLPGTEADPVMRKLIASRITSVVRDTLDGRPVLLTTPYGHFFTYYDLIRQKWVSRSDSIQKILSRYHIRDNLIRKFVKTKNGRIWLANTKGGLSLFRKKADDTLAFVNNPMQGNSISNNNVYDIKEDHKGNLWVSTYGGGLNYFDARKNTFRHFTSMENLFEGMEYDRQGHIWMISNGNLQKFDSHTHAFYSVELPDIEKNGGVKGALYKDGEEWLYAGGPGYYISFLPEQIITAAKQPDVHLTEFSVFDEPHSHLLTAGEIVLNYRQNFFTFHFAAPFYAASAPVQYSYMLKGVDKDWVNAGTVTQAHYTHISSGEYVFKVRATTIPGTWSDKVTTIKVRIIPPLWARWWFLLLLGTAIAAIVYGIYRYRINELLQRQAIRNKIAQDLHDNMGSALSSISIYSQVAKVHQKKNNQQELQQTLERISDTSGEMISEMNDIVWAVNPRNDSMEMLLQRMESYARPLLSAQEIRCLFEYDPGLKNIHLSMKARKNFYLIFKEGINNAVKYAQANHFKVEVWLKQQHIWLRMEDDGRGFDKAVAEKNSKGSLSGNGLHNMQVRAAEMNGQLTINSVEGKGTVIELVFPV